MSSDVYAITNLQGYASQMRDAAAKNLSDEPEHNLDEYITLGQIMNMIKKECIGFDDENRPLLDEKANEKIFENTSIWIYNSALAKLAAKDLVECAWDNDINEMIFWSKEKKKNGRTKRSKNRKDTN